MRQRILLLLALGTFSAALFLPLIENGFVHDDFVWLYIVASEPSWYGFTHPIQLFYTPLTWLTFKADWLLWGLTPFPMAVENLALHIIACIYRVTFPRRRMLVPGDGDVFAECGFSKIVDTNFPSVTLYSVRGRNLTN